jgi:hypothetical protein
MTTHYVEDWNVEEGATKCGINLKDIYDERFVDDGFSSRLNFVDCPHCLRATRLRRALNLIIHLTKEALRHMSGSTLSNAAKRYIHQQTERERDILRLQAVLADEQEAIRMYYIISLLATPWHNRTTLIYVAEELLALGFSPPRVLGALYVLVGDDADPTLT